MGDPTVPDFAGLAAWLRALASPVRLELLRVLRYPHALGDIRLAPGRKDPDRAPQRAVARQTVQMHLDRLVEAGFVRVDRPGADARQAPRYILDQQSVYGFIEDLRQLSMLQGGHVRAGDMTGTGPEPPIPQAARGLRLVLVHGVHEGKAFPLASGRTGPTMVGRRLTADVPLDYDRYVSLDHCAVAAASKGIAVEDLDSKNGTFVNWRRIPPRAPQPLRCGDIIGVGRSLLCFNDS